MHNNYVHVFYVYIRTFASLAGQHWAQKCLTTTLIPSNALRSLRCQCDWLTFSTYSKLSPKPSPTRTCILTENMQTPRVAQGVDRRLYFLGFKENLREVFGSNYLLALLPVATRSGHCHYFLLHKLLLLVYGQIWSTFVPHLPGSDRYLKSIF